MDYTVYYYNLGRGAAPQATLNDPLPPGVSFVSASDGGIYYPDNRTVVWDVGTVGAYGAENWYNYRTVTVNVPDGVPAGTSIQNTATLYAGSYTASSSASTTVVENPLPDGAGVGPTYGDWGGIPVVYWGEPVTFTYTGGMDVTGVDINIHVNDGGDDINDIMAGGPPTWSYTITLYPRHGDTIVTYTVHYANATDSNVTIPIYIDPAGYVYDAITGARIEGATVWLQRPDGFGGWENVYTGQVPAVMQPDTNPLVTGPDGRYQWDTLNGTYRVHVEAEGYLPADSIAVNVPPAVTDLHVGLKPIPTTYTLNLKQGWNLVSSPLVLNGLNTSAFKGTNVTMVARYNRSTGGFDIYRVGKTPTPFPMEADQGYFLYCNHDMTYMFEGYVETGRSVTINQGWNLVGWTNQTASNARDVAKGLRNVTMIARYNVTTGNYDIYRVGKTPTPFNVVAGEGYFLYTIYADPQKFIMR
jgi:uncharacterized repeat protein (TIGR01451 family)